MKSILVMEVSVNVLCRVYVMIDSLTSCKKTQLPVMNTISLHFRELIFTEIYSVDTHYTSKR